MSDELSFLRTEEPEETPISVTELKHHLRIADLTDSDEDDLLDLYIKSAVGVCEQYCRIALVEQTWTAKADRFCRDLVLPRAPLILVTEITYIDSAGQVQTLDPTTYVQDTFSKPGRVRLAYGKSWPTTRTEPQAVTIEWLAGYGGAEDVPENLKHGLKLLCGAWYGIRDTIDVGSPSELPLPWPVRLLFDQFQLARVW